MVLDQSEFERTHGGSDVGEFREEEKNNGVKFGAKILEAEVLKLPEVYSRKSKVEVNNLEFWA